jgi:aryl sulfotransferase
MIFDRGADSFFHKGTNGRWHDVLTQEQLERYDALVADDLPADAAHWLESGPLALGLPAGSKRELLEMRKRIST